MFPKIETIDDVLPWIEGKDEFQVKRGDSLVVIDYTHHDTDTFDSPQAMECRGIKFYHDGTLAARPLHKFFNRGERPDLEEQCQSESFILREKLDGSMIHPIVIEDRVEFCTKAGITDVAQQCVDELEMSETFLEINMELMDMGLTPIYEYTSPSNRIVVKYDEPSLTLIAVRDNCTGTYGDIEGFAKRLGVSTPKVYDDSIEDIKEWVEREGVVIEYDNEYRLKVKSDDYVLKHRTKDSLSQEKNVLSIILDDSVDDMVGILEQDDMDNLRYYQARFWDNFDNVIGDTLCVVNYVKGWDRKDIAKHVMSGNANLESTALFWQIYDGKDPTEALLGIIKKNLSSQSKIDKIRGLIGETWKY